MAFLVRASNLSKFHLNATLSYVGLFRVKV
jgi:hypothetical protein